MSRHKHTRPRRKTQGTALLAYIVVVEIITDLIFILIGMAMKGG